MGAEILVLLDAFVFHRRFTVFKRALLEILSLVSHHLLQLCVIRSYVVQDFVG